jgi:hypothetical protein
VRGYEDGPFMIRNQWRSHQQRTEAAFNELSPSVLKIPCSEGSLEDTGNGYDLLRVWGVLVYAQSMSARTAKDYGQNLVQP